MATFTDLHWIDVPESSRRTIEHRIVLSCLRALDRVRFWANAGARPDKNGDARRRRGITRNLAAAEANYSALRMLAPVTRRPAIERELFEFRGVLADIIAKNPGRGR